MSWFLKKVKELVRKGRDQGKTDWLPRSSDVHIRLSLLFKILVLSSVFTCEKLISRQNMVLKDSKLQKEGNPNQPP